MTKLSSNSSPAHVVKGASRRSVSREVFQHTQGRVLSEHLSPALVTKIVSSEGGPPDAVIVAAPAENLCSQYAVLTLRA